MSKREKKKVSNGAAILVTGLIVYALMTVLTRMFALPNFIIVVGHGIGIALELSGMYLVMKEYKKQKNENAKKNSKSK